MTKRENSTLLGNPNSCILPDEEIARIIKVILSTAEVVVKQMKVEKKETGDYSKERSINIDGIDMLFSVRELEKDKYPSPISVNLVFRVKVFRNGREILRSHVVPIKHAYGSMYYYENKIGKFKSWACYVEARHIEPLFRSGDTICIKNGSYGKVAFAKVEILSEEQEFKSIIRNVRLQKVLGHKEVLAYEKGYPAQVETYVADESTEEFFDGKDTLELVLETSYSTEEKTYDDFLWHAFVSERTAHNSKFEIGTPVTKEEMTLKLKKKALEKLLEDCRGEFCYGDPRVKNYKKYYMILGEERIDAIHNEYMAWLKENCTTFPQDAPSGEFTSIAIDWHGKEDQQPVYEP